MAAWPAPPPYVRNAELSRPTTEKKLFSEWDQTGAGEGRLPTNEETFHFKRLHYCAFHLARLYRKAAKTPRKVRIQREFSRWLVRYHAIRQRLIEANLGLVYDLIGRSRFGALDRDEMCSESMMALLRAVDTFDPWRGFRFSTYACNAILRAFSRAALRDSKRKLVAGVSYEPAYEKSDYLDRRRDTEQGLYEERLRFMLATNDAELTPVERSVLERRFPTDVVQTRETLDDIGRDMKVSKERVRQIQLAALGKLRKLLEADAILQ
ncbi:MAG: sigma-70 family RNA polymerase sigma factor [Phycisphaerae bacterium]